jgi:hypothetical protein
LFEHYALGESGRKLIPDGSLTRPACARDGEQRKSEEAQPMSALWAEMIVVFDDDLIRPRTAALADVEHALERTGSTT